MKTFPLTVIFLLMTFGTSATADPIQAPSDSISETDQLIHDAGHAIDDAWEAFHKAALGGTLASPEIQSLVERDLMHSRELLREARRAQHKGMNDEVRRITDQIRLKSRQIVKESQREKE